MELIYEKYYKEIKDESGAITDIQIDYPEDFNFAYDVMDWYAEHYPDKLALLHKSAEGVVTRFSFKQLKELTNKAANALKTRGIGKSDSVMLLLKRRYEFWISILALHKLGAVAIPTSHMVSAADIRERAQMARIKAVICVNSEHICDKVTAAIQGLEGEILEIVVGEGYRDCPSFDEMLKNADDSWDRVPTKATDDMLYYFTSGTSGEPKAVIHDYSYPIAHIYTARNWHGVIPFGLHLTVADSGWAKSAWGKLYGQWFMGTCIMVYDYEQFYAADMLKLLEEERINTFCAPPTIYKYLILEDLEKYNLHNLRYATTAGEPMPSEVSSKFKEKTGLTIREGFGQTETALQICIPIDGEQKDGSIGKASPLYEIELVDEACNPVGPGEEGEIIIRPKGDLNPIGIFKGYLGDQERYEEVWRGGVYHTCDKATKDQDGYFYFVGRNDDVIKSSGYRIGPSEVEDILMQHGAVFECAVTAYPSKNRGSVVKASIILNKGFEASDKLKTEVQEFVKKRAAIYKYPRIIKFVKELPRTSNGKISRAKIREADYRNLKTT
ncbi:AMP-binding protein [Butyrivibrio proteoclasticus]|uniref:AMP-binding protein n=1 Tax=Butyrivibrio proteoclasticus TaxID=43305 RepID=UPI00047A2490|nr:AMP-binding protein [Butyrivibrio proteoclasticus]